MRMRHRLVACGGLNRSGSTWQYNAVRFLLAAAYGETEIYSCWIDDYTSGNPLPIHVVKFHSLETVEQYLPDAILTSHRDLRAVVGSMIRMKWLLSDSGTVIGWIENYVKNAAALSRIACFDMQYEQMLEHPLQTLCETASALNLEFAQTAMERVYDRITALEPPGERPGEPNSSFSPTTLLHRGHIGMSTNDAAIKYIPLDLQSKIGIHFADWLTKHGYNV